MVAKVVTYIILAIAAVIWILVIVIKSAIDLRSGMELYGIVKFQAFMLIGIILLILVIVIVVRRNTRCSYCGRAWAIESMGPRRKNGHIDEEKCRCRYCGYTFWREDPRE